MLSSKGVKLEPRSVGSQSRVLMGAMAVGGDSWGTSTGGDRETLRAACTAEVKHHHTENRQPSRMLMGIVAGGWGKFEDG